MRSPQTLSEADRRAVAAWAADCAERVLPIFEAAAPGDGRPRNLLPARGLLHAASLTSQRESAAASQVASRRASYALLQPRRPLARPDRPQPLLIWAPMPSAPPHTPRRPLVSPRLIGQML